MKYNTAMTWLLRLRNYWGYCMLYNHCGLVMLYVTGYLIKQWFRQQLGASWHVTTWTIVDLSKIWSATYLVDSSNTEVDNYSHYSLIYESLHKQILDSPNTRGWGSLWNIQIVISDCSFCFNSLSPGDTYMQHCTGSSLVQLMAWH